MAGRGTASTDKTATSGAKPRRRDRIRKNWAERFAARAQRTPLLVLASFAAVVVSSVTILTGTGIHLWHWYTNRVDWRTGQYHKLASLIAGFSLDQFKSTLGAPVFVQVSPRAHLTESTFRGRDFWVQTISDRNGVVLSYAVTSCALDFTPAFSMIGQRAVLQRSTFSALGRQLGGGPDVTADYFLSGATANTYFLDSFYGGNPTAYKTYAWGIDDACPASFDYYRYFASRKPLFQEYHGLVSHLPPAAAEFRSLARINTYAETAPGVDLEKLRRAFQIGVDRQLVRTAPA